MLLTPILDSYFNPLILDGYFMGFYFLLYVQALWKLARRKRHGILIFTLTILWMALTSKFIFNWVRARNAFVINNDSPMAILNALLNFANKTPATTVLVATIFSDAILIWRTYVFWEKQWMVSVLSTLVLASSVCRICFIAFPKNSTTAVLLGALASIFSAMTSLIVTSLITIKLVHTTRDSGVPYTVAKVTEIFVQSAALQSTVLLLHAIVSLGNAVVYVPGSWSVWAHVAAYTATCSRAVMGIAPTLIAFRVADEKRESDADEPKKTSALSRITFRRTARQTDTFSAADRTRISTIRFGTTIQRGDQNESFQSVHQAESRGGVASVNEKEGLKGTIGNDEAL